MAGSDRRIVSGQPSWRVASESVEAFVTELGGQLGPVIFDRAGRKIRPYSVAPWAEEKFRPPLPPVIQALRGDFFCLPFGANTTPFRGERHPIHGETANARWRFESLETENDCACLHLSLRTKIRRGRVDKRIVLMRGHNTVYSEHVVSGMAGPMNPGHHAMIKFPDEPGGGLISTSPFVYGQVLPQQFEAPERRGYQSLKPGAEFDSLKAVPILSGGNADLTRFPARCGFEDLLMVVSDPDLRFAWTAVSFPRQRYVWFALKDRHVLRQTIFWISNGGRHYPPWNGRHINVMGIEEVTAYFHLGLAESARKNPLSGKGIPTCLRLDPRKPLRVAYIMGIAKTPAGFDEVAGIEAEPGEQQIVLTSCSGRSVKAKVDLSFLRLEA